LTFIHVYYQIKPLIPRKLQIFLRRRIAFIKQRTKKAIWPIDPAAAKKPEGWRGWPGQKKFALILQHDVDSYRGLTKCTLLLDIESQLGFRSAFNFVPEDYPTPRMLLDKLSTSGFEIGVHGLKHDGKLFQHREGFIEKVPRINHYLREWESLGFTSPSMLRNLSLMAELEIEHGCSTFDTDPYEPQSDGVGTIFPFFAHNSSKTRTYIELPYTLPQDHCLFVILKKRDNRIWRDKLDWIADNGGMVSLNSHPDYMNFGETPSSAEEYPAGYYIDFLKYVLSNYAGQYWHVLPREMAHFWRTSMVDDEARIRPGMKLAKISSRKYSTKKRKDPIKPGVRIWVDLDNTPHVPFFIPIIRELERRGHKVVLTARDAFQVCELADEKGLRYTKIGHHYGKNAIMKVIGLFWRTAQLLPFYLREKPAIALSHGARSQTLLCKLFHVPSILIGDYEYARYLPMALPSWGIVPETVPADKLPIKPHRIRYYRGIKEDVYVPEFRPDPAFLEELGLRPDDLIVTVRPPANEAHYYNPESDVLLVELMSRICQTSNIRAVLLPRNLTQEQSIRAKYPQWFENDRTVVPARALDGLNILWFSDFVVSGGGTMNREAAALGVPVFSIFRGRIGAVDTMLAKEGRLTLIRSIEEIWTKIPFTRRDKTGIPDSKPRAALLDIISQIEDIIRLQGVKPYRRGEISQS
jgi:predicted glycosyltransferase